MYQIQDIFINNKSSRIKWAKEVPLLHYHYHKSFVAIFIFINFTVSSKRYIRISQVDVQKLAWHIMPLNK